MVKAFFKGFQITEIDYEDHSGWVKVNFGINDITGKCRVRMEDIELREVEE